MENELSRTMFDPRIPQILSGIKQCARTYTGEELKKRLDDLLLSEREDIEEIKSRIIEDTMLQDYMLEDLTGIIAGKLIRGEKRNQYIIVTKCKPCSDSGNDERVKKSKIVQHIPTRKYIHEVGCFDDLMQNAIEPAGFIKNCVTCGNEYEATNSRNLIMPANKQEIYAIAARVKSAGRYCQKLVDVIFYSKDNPKMKKRSILDRYAFACVKDAPEGVSEEENDKQCYGILERMRMDNLLIDMKLLQDNIRDPIRRLSQNRKPEMYKMLQFPLKYHGKMFEGQIKTKNTFLREQDRKSAIWHDNYVEIEEQLRQDMFREMPEAKIVYDTLIKMFTHNRYNGG
jgi:hypothetical protein